MQYSYAKCGPHWSTMCPDLPSPHTEQHLPLSVEGIHISPLLVLLIFGNRTFDLFCCNAGFASLRNRRHHSWSLAPLHPASLPVLFVQLRPPFFSSLQDPSQTPPLRHSLPLSPDEGVFHTKPFCSRGGGGWSLGFDALQDVAMGSHLAKYQRGSNCCLLTRQFYFCSPSPFVAVPLTNSFSQVRTLRVQQCRWPRAGISSAAMSLCSSHAPLVSRVFVPLPSVPRAHASCQLLLAQ